MPELPKCERDFDIAYQEWERDSAEWFDQEEWDKALESWISPFLEERDFGYAILQRRRRLLSIKPAARPKCEDKSQMKSPDYQEAERKREEEVNELMEAYWTSIGPCLLWMRQCLWLSMWWRLFSSVPTEIVMVARIVGSWVV